MTAIRDRRKYFRAKLHSLYLPLYDSLCRELSNEWQPYFGFRTIKLQDRLYQRGRSQPGNIVTWARGGESPHNHGCASDWTLFRGTQAVWLKADDPKWKEYEAACKKLGLVWGGHFKKPDCFHNELKISISWKEVSKVLSKEGDLKAKQFIETKILDEKPNTEEI